MKRIYILLTILILSLSNLVFAKEPKQGKFYSVPISIGSSTSEVDLVPVGQDKVLVFYVQNSYPYFEYIDIGKSKIIKHDKLKLKYKDIDSITEITQLNDKEILITIPIAENQPNNIEIYKKVNLSIFNIDDFSIKDLGDVEIDESSFRIKCTKIKDNKLFCVGNNPKLAYIFENNKLNKISHNKQGCCTRLMPYKDGKFIIYSLSGDKIKEDLYIYNNINIEIFDSNTNTFSDVLYEKKIPSVWLEDMFIYKDYLLLHVKPSSVYRYFICIDLNTFKEKYTIKVYDLIKADQPLISQTKDGKLLLAGGIKKQTLLNYDFNRKAYLFDIETQELTPLKSKLKNNSSTSYGSESVRLNNGSIIFVNSYHGDFTRHNNTDLYVP